MRVKFIVKHSAKLPLFIQIAPDIWRFIEGLNWLNPSLTASIANRSCSPTIHIPYARIKNDKALAWIYESLESHSLSQKVKCLLTDSEHLNTCYEVTAFLQNEKYVGAFLLCLKAIENNQSNLLTQIDVALYKSDKSQHKRSTSHPDFSFIPRTKVNLKTAFNSTNNSRPVDINNRKSSLGHCITDGRSAKRKSILKATKDIQLISLKLRPWSSLPDVHDISQPQRKRSTTMSQPIHIPNQNVRSKNPSIPTAMQNVPSFTYKQNASDSGSNHNHGDSLATLPSEGSSQMSSELIPIALLKCDDIKIHVDRKYRAKEPRTSDKKTSNPFPSEGFSFSPGDAPCRSGFIGNRNLVSIMVHHPDKSEPVAVYSGFGTGSAPADFVNEFIPREGEKIQNRYGKPTMADFGYNLLPTIGPQQRPKQGQSLTSFLQAAQFSRANTELERENAHFSVSEAMISAIEQIKWRRLQEIKDHSIDGSNVIHRKLKNRRQFTRTKSNTKAKSVESGSSSSDDSSGDSRYTTNEVSTANNLNQSQVIVQFIEHVI